MPSSLFAHPNWSIDGQYGPDIESPIATTWLMKIPVVVEQTTWRKYFNDATDAQQGGKARDGVGGIAISRHF